MMRNILILLLLCLFLLLASGCSDQTGTSGGNMTTIFADMENGIKNMDENLFKKHWHPEGYSRNLVGGSGLAGNRVFEQGSRKKWYPRRTSGQTEKIGRVEIVSTEIYAWERDKKVDEIYFAIAENKGKLEILGGGEDLAEVKSLAERFNAGNSLAVE
jgi:hypothetical protein